MGLLTGEVSLTVLRGGADAEWSEPRWTWAGGPVAVLTAWQLGVPQTGCPLDAMPETGADLQLGVYRCRVLAGRAGLEAVYVGRMGTTADLALIIAWQLLQEIRLVNARLLRQLARWRLAVPGEFGRDIDDDCPAEELGLKDGE